MKSISKLKDEARRHEQREEWEKAIQAYLQVLRIAEEGETEVELPLYNRLGDLCVRLGKPQEAVRHYEQAADRYAEAGLYNNAIALCNKALRYSPDRLELIRKLGQFSASQGFITDARRYFLDYAERQFKAGKVTEALSALEDFANVSDDAEIREMLGRQLHAHGRINDAVDELRRAHALRIRDGQTDQAAAIREEILSIDPNAALDGSVPTASAGPRSQDTTALPGLVEIEPEDAGSFTIEGADEATVQGLETGALPGDDAADLGAVELSGFETTGQPDLADIDLSAAGGIEGLETTALDFGSVDADTPALEELGLDREPTSFDGPADGMEADGLDLPLLDDASGNFDLPTLDEPEQPVDLPLLDEPEPPADLPLLDEPERAADLPLLDDSAGNVDVPDLDPTQAAAELPTFEPESPELPSIDEPAPADVPTLDDSSTDFDLPLLGEDSEEATPTAPPEIDDPNALDLPDQDSPDFGLGGDLPLDLSSFGGAGFDLPAAGESREDEWSTGEPSFDIPDLDGEALGIPGWEPEPGTSFELPSFEEGRSDDDEAAADVPGLEDAASETTPEAATDAAADVDAASVPEEPPPTGEPSAGEAVSEADRGGAPAEPIMVPAIELPTWDTDLAIDEPPPVPTEMDAQTAPAGAADEPDVAEPVEDMDAGEPSWVDAIAAEEDEGSPDLPTFTYEDDAAAEDQIAIGDEADDVAVGSPEAVDAAAAGEEAAEAAEDDDPLGLAAHLSGVQGRTVAQAEPPESDWLDDIADDEPDTSVEDEFRDSGADATALDAAGADEDTAEPGSAPEASLDDPAAETAQAQAAADEMAAAPPAGTEPPPAAAEPPAAAPPAGEQYIDLGAFITADDEEEESTRFRVQETAPTGDEDRDFAELLSQFKSKVQEHLPPEDAAAHYDLGLAFKEMGLIDEAIGEFQVALRAGHMRLKVYEELGQCFLQKEQFNIAEKVLSRALTMKFEDELELLGVYYHLGRAYEAMGRRDQARDAYERVLGMDINFGDVTDRLARL